MSGGRQEEAREQPHLSITTGRVKCLNLKCRCKDCICAGIDGKPAGHIIQVRILRMGQRQPHAAHSDGVQHSQFSAGRHKGISAEVSQKTLSERRRLVNK